MKIENPIEVTVMTNVYIDPKGICGVKTMLFCGTRLLGEMQCIDNASCTPEEFLAFASTADQSPKSFKIMML